VLFLVSTKRNAEQRVVAMFDCPLPDVGRDIVVLRIEASGTFRERVRRIEKDASDAVLRGDARAANTIPGSAADADAAEPVRERLEIFGKRALAVDPPPGIAKVRELAVDPLPGIAKVRELAVDPPPGIAKVREIALDPLPGSAKVRELARVA